MVDLAAQQSRSDEGSADEHSSRQDFRSHIGLLR
jgi:hypothetical protein